MFRLAAHQRKQISLLFVRSLFVSCLFAPGGTISARGLRGGGTPKLARRSARNTPRHILYKIDQPIPIKRPHDPRHCAGRIDCGRLRSPKPFDCRIDERARNPSTGFVAATCECSKLALFGYSIFKEAAMDNHELRYSPVCSDLRTFTVVEKSRYDLSIVIKRTLDFYYLDWISVGLCNLAACSNSMGP